MKYLIVLDAGHGMNTPGKRTPLFEDGTFMHERAFNKAVVEHMQRLLASYDCTVIWVSPEDNDVSLNTRVSRANTHYNNFVKQHGDSNIKAAFVSIHANANTGTWGSANGIETLYFPGRIDSLKFAQIVQQHMIEHTKLRDRGIKTGNFAVIRDIVCPSILCECGFMDYKPEAILLKSDNYRQTCAKAIVKGIVDYLNLPLNTPPTPSTTTEQPTTIQINLNGKIKTVETINRNGFNYIKLKDLTDDKISVTYNKLPIISIKP